ncbi:biotin/lipoyl-containing protein, partial [Staphylococcus hominis]
GDEVQANQPLLITEAMKMETTIQAPFDGIIKQINVANGDAIATGDLLVEIEKQS